MSEIPALYGQYDDDGGPLWMDGAVGKLFALRAENERLKMALEDIAVYGCGMLSQPPAMNSPEETWLRMRIREYEKRARAALSGEASADLLPVRKK